MFTKCFYDLAASGKCTDAASEYIKVMVLHFAVLVEELSFPDCELSKAYTCLYAWQMIVAPDSVRGLGECNILLIVPFS